MLQGAQLLPRDAQAPALARVTTAFLEAWMDHILAQRIKFRYGRPQRGQDGTEVAPGWHRWGRPR